MQFCDEEKLIVVKWREMERESGKWEREAKHLRSCKIKETPGHRQADSWIGQVQVEGRQTAEPPPPSRAAAAKEETEIERKEEKEKEKI